MVETDFKKLTKEQANGIYEAKLYQMFSHKEKAAFQLFYSNYLIMPILDLKIALETALRRIVSVEQIINYRSRLQKNYTDLNGAPPTLEQLCKNFTHSQREHLGI